MGPIIVWSIQRFGTLPLIPDKWLRSPIFYADSSKLAKFCLRIQGVGFPSNSNGHVAKLLFSRCDTDGPENVDIEYLIDLNWEGRVSKYKRRFTKPPEGCYGSYQTDALPLTKSDILKSEIKVICIIQSYDDDKYASSGMINRTDFDVVSHDSSLMFLKSEFSDAVIRIQNHELNVHKAVLDVRCPEFLEECQVKNLQKILDSCGDNCLRILLRYICSGHFLSLGVHGDLYLLLKKCNNSIFEQLFITFPRVLYTRTSFEENTIFITWDIKKFLKLKQCNDYCHNIQEGHSPILFSITFLKGETEYVEFVMRKLSKKAVLFVECKIITDGAKCPTTTIFEGNHLFNDEHPWKVQLDRALRATRNELEAKPTNFGILINVTDGKPTNSVESVDFSLISDACRYATENRFERSLVMGKLYKNPLHSDVTLIIKDNRIPAHKAILSARSPRFRETLQQNTFQTEIPINDLDEKVALSMLYYIYKTQVVDMDIDLALELYKAANLYEILPLKIKCSRYLELSLTASNLGEILLFADAQNDFELKEFVYKFITTHPRDVLESKLSMGIMRSYHYLHLDALKEICRHLAEKSAKEKYTESVKIPQI